MNKNDYLKTKSKYLNKKYKLPVVGAGIFGLAIISASIAIPISIKEHNKKATPQSGIGYEMATELNKLYADADYKLEGKPDTSIKGTTVYTYKNNKTAVKASPAPMPGKAYAIGPLAPTNLPVAPLYLKITVVNGTTVKAGSVKVESSNDNKTWNPAPAAKTVVEKISTVSKTIALIKVTSVTITAPTLNSIHLTGFEGSGSFTIPQAPKGTSVKVSISNKHTNGTLANNDVITFTYTPISKLFKITGNSTFTVTISGLSAKPKQPTTKPGWEFNGTKFDQESKAQAAVDGALQTKTTNTWTIGSIVSTTSEQDAQTKWAAAQVITNKKGNPGVQDGSPATSVTSAAGVPYWIFNNNAYKTEAEAIAAAKQEWVNTENAKGPKVAAKGAGDGTVTTQAKIDARDAQGPFPADKTAAAKAIVGVNTAQVGDGSGNNYTQAQIDHALGKVAKAKQELTNDRPVPEIKAAKGFYETVPSVGDVQNIVPAGADLDTLLTALAGLATPIVPVDGDKLTIGGNTFIYVTAAAAKTANAATTVVADGWYKNDAATADVAGLQDFQTNPPTFAVGDKFEAGVVAATNIKTYTFADELVVQAAKAGKGLGDGSTTTQAKIDARDAQGPFPADKTAAAKAKVGVNTAQVGDGSGNNYTQAQIDHALGKVAKAKQELTNDRAVDWAVSDAPASFNTITSQTATPGTTITSGSPASSITNLGGQVDYFIYDGKAYTSQANAKAEVDKVAKTKKATNKTTTVFTYNGQTFASKQDAYNQLIHQTTITSPAPQPGPAKEVTSYMTLEDLYFM